MGNPTDTDYETVETVLVVGGGDGGLMTALALQEYNPEFDIRIVDNFADPIPEIGKSTITYILEFLHDILGIDRTRFVSEVRPVWKGSVYFRDWCGNDPFHVPFDIGMLQPGQPGRRRFEMLYHRYRTDNFHTLGGEIAERATTPVLDDGDIYGQVAYQFSTDRLNTFLREVCSERGIELIDDEIHEVTTRGDRIERVASDTAEYEADLYLDATGFERVLMGELDNDFERFEFPLDSALVTKAEVALSEIEPATVITSGDYGWFWQIDTYDWRDLGYVYSSSHVSKPEAVEEFVATREEELSVSEMREYEFDSGVYERAWVGNCIAIGNALGFVEPLQSTAVTLNAKLTDRLSELLSDHHGINHPGARGIYNQRAHDVWEDVFSFVSLHYRYADGETEFWEAARSIPEPDRASEHVENYHNSGFNSYEYFDRGGEPTLKIFNHYLYAQLLHALGVESEFYENVDVDVSPSVEEDVEDLQRRIETDVEDFLPYDEVYQRELNPPLAVVLR